MGEDAVKKQNEEINATAASAMVGESTGSASAASVRSAARWREQCVLARALPKVLAQTRLRKKPWQYVTSFSSQTSDSTAMFLNRLHQAGGNEHFVNISTYERANMLWNIKLSKILYKTSVDGLEYEFDKEIPLIFEKMAAEDMSNYHAESSVEHHKKGFNAKSFEGRPQTGYGIKSFDWAYIGGNPETVRNDIEATLVLEFQNFDQLSRVRYHDDKDNTPYNLLDLLGYGPNSPKNKKADRAIYDPALYEIKATVAWVANPGIISGELQEKSDDTPGGAALELQDKVKGQSTTLFLTMIDHDFSISQLGTFTLTLTYRARLESVSSEMRTNVVFSPTDVGGHVNDLRIIDELMREEAKKCDSKTFQVYQDKRELILKTAWHQSFNQMLSRELKGGEIANKARMSRYPQDIYLEEERSIDLTGMKYSDNPTQWRIHEVAVPFNNLRDYINGVKDLGPAAVKFYSKQADVGSTVTEASTLATEAANEQDGAEGAVDAKTRFATFGVRALAPPVYPGADGDEYYPIKFILFGDLLEIMAHRAFSDKNFLTSGAKTGSFGTAKMLKVISGPVRLTIDGQEHRCSLSDIPIALDSFVDFWTRNVVEPERELYSFVDFVRDIGSQLIGPAFGEGCIAGQTKSFVGQTRLKTAFLSLPMAEDGSDPLFHLEKGTYDSVTGDILVENLDDGDIFNPHNLAAAKPEDIFHYFVLYLDNMDAAKDLTGDEDEDAKKGIYHLKIHQGILQSINFSKADQPYLRESRFFMYNDNPLVHLSNVYNVNASMVGNTCFYPGDTVYINPIGFGTSLGSPMDADESPSLSAVMGLGGYHTIISVKNKVSKDFVTQIEALWTSNGAGQVRSEDDIDGCEDNKTSKLLEGDDD